MNPLIVEKIGRLDYEERLREAAEWRRVRALPRRPGPWRARAGRAIERLGARIAEGRQPEPATGRRRAAGAGATPRC